MDDEVDFAAFVGRVAEQLGFEVTILTDPLQFKETFERVQPTDLALDMVMPDIDGIELVQWIAARGSQVRIIIMSGFNPRYAKAAEMLGQVKGRLSITSLTKPVDLNTLRGVLSQDEAPGSSGG